MGQMSAPFGYKYCGNNTIQLEGDSMKTTWDYKYYAEQAFVIVGVIIFAIAVLGASYGLMKACDDGEAIACWIMEE